MTVSDCATNPRVLTHFSAARQQDLKQSEGHFPVLTSATAPSGGVNFAHNQTRALRLWSTHSEQCAVRDLQRLEP